jgi:hypothetical protein
MKSTHEPVMITINIDDSNGGSTKFKVDRKARIDTVLDTYAKLMDRNVSEICFHHMDEGISRGTGVTLRGLHVDDMDTIYAHLGEGYPPFKVGLRLSDNNAFVYKAVNTFGRFGSLKKRVARKLGVEPGDLEFSYNGKIVKDEQDQNDFGFLGNGRVIKVRVKSKSNGNFI